jgi:hypothetical protein
MKVYILVVNAEGLAYAGPMDRSEICFCPKWFKSKDEAEGYKDTACKEACVKLQEEHPCYEWLSRNAYATVFELDE